MLTYEYICKANGKTVTVQHRMTESLRTWGELCARAGVNPDGAPADAPVERIISGGTLAIRSEGKHPLTGSDIGTTGDACAQPVSCCGGGSCQHRK